MEKEMEDALLLVVVLIEKLVRVKDGEEGRRVSQRKKRRRRERIMT